ncbi:MAG: hypothetical protein ACP5N1_03960 [Candidatus Woesearchaeota archaeon]
MGEGLEQAITQVFNQKYSKIKPILDNILPQIKKEGWIDINKITGEYTKKSNSKLTIKRLESEINNLYFHYNKNFYEQKNPNLKKIDTFWYGLLREFFYNWSNISPNTMHQRLLKDYEYLLEKE